MFSIADGSCRRESIRQVTTYLRHLGHGSGSRAGKSEDHYSVELEQQNRRSPHTRTTKWRCFAAEAQQDECLSGASAVYPGWSVQVVSAWSGSVRPTGRLPRTYPRRRDVSLAATH